MKRLLIVFGTLVTVAVFVCALRDETARAAQSTASRRELWRIQEQRFEELRAEREQLREQVKNEKSLVPAQLPVGRGDSLAAEFAANGLKNLSPENAERLLAELGFNWNSNGYYLIVSKTSLPGIRVPAIRRARLTEAARAALVITGDEQGAIDAELQRLTSEYHSWLQSHVRREEPSGNVLAKYVLTPDPQFSETASNGFASIISSTLGPERAALLQQYSWNWMESLGMVGNDGSTSMTIKREGDYMTMELRQATSSMSCGLSPGQPMPEAFQPLFPGGWKDLAEREGFELPKEFQEK